MPFDGITIHALCPELENSLINSRVDKIHQPEKDELVFSIHHPQSGNLKLLISANARWARMHLREGKSKNPAAPSGFCMLLRKYLEGGKIKSIKQLGWERIVHITIEALNDFREWRTLTLICEFMGKHSNIILVNPETGIIVDAIKKYSHELSSYREVLPGNAYVYPPEQSKIDVTQTDRDKFCAAIWENENSSLFQALFNSCAGFSPFAAREFCYHALLDPYSPADQCGPSDIYKLLRIIQETVRNIEDGSEPASVLYAGKKPEDVAGYSVNSHSAGGKAVYFSSASEACTVFFTKRMEITRLESIKNNLTRNIKDHLQKAHRKKFLQSSDLAQAEKNMSYRVWGELLTAYAHQIQKGEPRVILSDFYTSEPVEITLAPHLTPMQNAQKFFKIYNKSVKTIKNLEKLSLQTQANIEYLDSVLLALEQAETIPQLEEIIEELEKENFIKVKNRGNIKKKHAEPLVSKSSPRRFISAEGWEILVGRNNRQNDLLTLKTAGRHDLWLHVKNQAGTHVIIKNPSSVQDLAHIPNRTLETAAALAAYYSKASQAEKVEVDYTWRKNVHKPAGFRPGLVIYTDYRTIIANPQSIITSGLLETEF
ncbi:MAG: NFACT family protein [Syntrophomonadaceae bacterium]|nr:NFACT family protein [Syntrophomonadaceae bacterium]